MGWVFLEKELPGVCQLLYPVQGEYNFMIASIYLEYKVVHL